jgi:hypothetical protein
MTLTSLLAFVSGAVMARFKEPTVDDRDHRIEELETVCNRLTATLRATTEQLLNTRLENEALRINLYGVYPRPLSPEQQAEFGRQFPARADALGLQGPQGAIGSDRPPPNEWQGITGATGPGGPTGPTDMLREYDRVFGLPRPRDPQLQMQAGLAYPVPGQVQRELSEFTEHWRSCTCVPGRADMFLRDPRIIPE